MISPLRLAQFSSPFLQSTPLQGCPSGNGSMMINQGETLRKRFPSPLASTNMILMDPMRIYPSAWVRFMLLRFARLLWLLRPLNTVIGRPPEKAFASLTRGRRKNYSSALQTKAQSSWSTTSSQRLLQRSCANLRQWRPPDWRWRSGHSHRK